MNTRDARDNRIGSLLLHLVDSYGMPIAVNTEVIVRNQALHDNRRYLLGNDTSLITGLYGPPNDLYVVELYPAKYYRPVRRFMKASTDSEQRVVPMAIEPGQVRSVQFNELDTLPQVAQDLLKRSSVSIETAFTPIVQAGFYNIVAKMNRTQIQGSDRGGTSYSVLSYFKDAHLTTLHGDRFFAEVPYALLSDIRDTLKDGVFTEVSSLLHNPPVGYHHAGSFKTYDSYGNLQLTFFYKAPDQYMVDADIDDAGGLGHVFQVVGNALRNEPTHPYNIHEILLVHQELDPGYRFVL